MANSTPYGRLAGLLVISVLALALTGLFGVWSAHRQADRALLKANQLTALTEASRTAQIDFKTEVQLWKNLLLRGQIEGQFQNYQTKLQEQQQMVNRALAAFDGMPGLPSDLAAMVGQIKADHTIVAETYARGAAAYVVGDPSSIFRVDASVKGVDQALNARFDQLADALAAHREKELVQLQAEGEQLYQGLSLATVIVSVIASLVALLMAWKVVRARP